MSAAGNQREVGLEKANPRSIGNYLVIAMFAGLGAVDLLDREFLDAGLWLSLAAALGFFGRETTPWGQIAPWRKLGGMVLLVVAIALFAIRIATDIAN